MPSRRTEFHVGGIRHVGYHVGFGGVAPGTLNMDRIAQCPRKHRCEAPGFGRDIVRIDVDGMLHTLGMLQLLTEEGIGYEANRFDHPCTPRA